MTGATDHGGHESMHRAKIVTWVWGVAQVVIGTGLGILSIKFLPDKTAADVVGPLLSFAGFVTGVSYIVAEYQLDAILKREIASVRSNIDQWKESAERLFAGTTVKLLERELGDLRKLLPVFNSYIASGGNDHFGHRDRVLSSAQHQLDELARGRMELEGDDYYAWLKNRLVERRPKRVEAISLRPLSVYATDAREKNFLKNNFEAIKKGTQITRIFILSEDELIKKDARTIVRHQFLEGGVVCFVAWKSQVGTEAVRKLGGGGLSIYDGEELFYDRSYFERTVGDMSEIELAPVTGTVKPRALVFTSAHPQFHEFRNLFAHILENVIDPSQRDGSCHVSYRWVCEYLLLWATGSSQVSEQDRKALEDEISQLQDAAKVVA